MPNFPFSKRLATSEKVDPLVVQQLLNELREAALQVAARYHLHSAFGLLGTQIGNGEITNRELGLASSGYGVSTAKTENATYTEAKIATEAFTQNKPNWNQFTGLRTSSRKWGCLEGDELIGLKTGDTQGSVTVVFASSADYGQPWTWAGPPHVAASVEMRDGWVGSAVGFELEISAVTTTQFTLTVYTDTAMANYEAFYVNYRAEGLVSV